MAVRRRPDLESVEDGAWDAESGRRRCVRIKKDGERCKKRPVSGTTVCASHGAAEGSPIRAQADKAVEQAKFEQAVVRTLKPRTGVDPATAYQSALEVSAGALDAGLGLAEGVSLDTQEGAALVEAVLGLAERAAKIAKLGLDAGIDQRHADRLERLEGEQAAVVVKLLTTVRDSPALALTPEQRAAWGQVVRAAVVSLTAGPDVITGELAG